MSSYDMHWKLQTIILCVYGAIKEFRPATPFLTPYLTSSFKNFTNNELYAEVYPFWTYSYLIALVPVFFLTDILRYKPVVVAEAITLCGTFALLTWGTTVWQMQIMQIMFGISSACEIAYFSYMYSAVEQQFYAKITSYVRAAALVGRFSAYSFAQYLISSRNGTYLSLVQISFGAPCIALLIAIWLPPIRSKSQRRAGGLSDGISDGAAILVQPPTIDNGLSAYFAEIWNCLALFKRNRAVLKWSIYYAFTSAGTFQIFNYIQTLWSTMQSVDAETQNGTVECLNTLIGAILSFAVQYVTINWEKFGEMILFSSSFIAAVILFIISKTMNIIVSYSLYVTTTAIYFLLITAASMNIANQLNSASYGLIFAGNTFTALIIQTIITLAVADEHGFMLDIRNQFVAYACFFLGLSMIFLSFIITKFFQRTTAPQRNAA